MGTIVPTIVLTNVRLATVPDIPVSALLVVSQVTLGTSVTRHVAATVMGVFAIDTQESVKAVAISVSMATFVT